MEPKRILLAEYEPETARHIESELQNLGLIVDTVADSKAAWNLLLTIHCDVFICDENLQGVGFLDLARQIRMEPKLAFYLPIVFIAGQIPEPDGLYGPPFAPYADVTIERHNLSEISKWVQRILTPVNTSDSHYLL